MIQILATEIWIYFPPNFDIKPDCASNYLLQLNVTLMTLKLTVRKYSVPPEKSMNQKQKLKQEFGMIIIAQVVEDYLTAQHG